MHLKKEDAWKKAQARQREAHQELERKKATEERIKKVCRIFFSENFEEDKILIFQDKERQELKAQIHEGKTIKCSCSLKVKILTLNF